MTRRAGSAMHRIETAQLGKWLESPGAPESGVPAPDRAAKGRNGATVGPIPWGARAAAWPEAAGRFNWRAPGAGSQPMPSRTRAIISTFRGPARSEARQVQPGASPGRSAWCQAAPQRIPSESVMNAKVQSFDENGPRRVRRVLFALLIIGGLMLMGAAVATVFALDASAATSTSQGAAHRYTLSGERIALFN